MRQRIEVQLPGGGDRDETAPRQSVYGWSAECERWYRLFDAEMKGRGSKHSDDYKAAQFYAAYQKWGDNTMKKLRHAAKLCAKGVDIAARDRSDWTDWAIDHENEWFPRYRLDDSSVVIFIGTLIIIYLLKHYGFHF